ncbi:serine hydrolase [Rudanella paleaurantiibacter]|uniref:Serine hydrolase n=1 Tax=Rudanella paleaurantiibacter TaxID=2614655 RepID=A0A7J5U528_9BACT|nr:serine hydrolase domain-containing protein [Rudanella paleaurantiibacter]KAB7732697.1 serine hydrolase [Rudanella paleaurantiibacter]
MRSVFTLLFLCLQLTVSAQKPLAPVLQEARPETVGMSADRLQRLDRVVQQYIDEGKQAGVAVLIARHGKIVHHKAYGYDNLAQKTPLRRDAIFRIASQTKAITSMGVLILLEEGKLLLDDPISKYIPAFKATPVLDKFNEKDTSFTTVPARREITIRHLLTHTSGIGYPQIGSKEANAIYAKYSIPSGIGTPNANLAEAVDRLAKLPLLSQPGERWIYSLSIDVLGRLIEVVSGQSLDAFLRTRLFEPLGMNDTFFYLPTSKHNRLTTLYTEDADKKTIPYPARNGQSADYPKQAGGFYSGGAGLSSTLLDYAIFLQMVMNGGTYNGKRILSPTTIRMALSNQIGDLNVGAGKFGLGFALTTEKGAARMPISEGSFDWGGYFGTTYWGDPKEGIVALIYTQKVPNSFGDLTDKFKVLVYQAIGE